MEVRIHGCRGSIASPGPQHERYGGNTSCVEIRTDGGEVVVLDAGTGLRPLGVELADQGVDEVHVLLTHLHLDHLQGLGFFRPLFDPANRVHLWGPPSPVQSLGERIGRYLSPPLFPVRLEDVPADLVLHDAGEEPVEIGGATVVAAPVTHQGPTVGYRITDASGSLAYLPDHEPALGVDITTLDPTWVSGYDLIHDVDLLLHDAQYTDEEYPRHVGWGHSAIDHVLHLAAAAGVGELVLFHHDPYHDDDALDAAYDRALAAAPDGLRVTMAREGMTVRVGALR